MESLNLHSLSTTLNAPNPEFNDKELIKDFKAAAQSLTTLYRSARQSSKRAYDAGYIAACEDLLSMIQTGVSLSSSAGSSVAATSTAWASSSSEMGIGKIMDWVEARLEAVKARQEEELEEEANKAPPKQVTASPRLRTRSSASPPPPPLPPSSHSTLVLTPLTTPNGTTARRQSKLRTNVLPTPPSSSSNLSLNPGPLIVEESPSILGTKRRHAVMLLDTNSSGSSQTQPTSSRRRTRSWRNQNLNLTPDGFDAMDIEEEGRERKRLASGSTTRR